MNTRIVIYTAALAIASAAAWFHAHSTARQLQAQLELLRGQQRELRGLHSERARLNGEIATLADTAAENTPPPAAPRAVTPTAAPAPFTLGEWTPYASWSNRGQSSPRAAFETALWAAAGGDALTMQALLELDPATRTKAESLLNKLSPVARSTYVTPEALVANVTMKNIPLTKAQIAWYHESDPDHAAVGVLFGNVESLPDPVVKIPAGKTDNSPPTLSDNRTTKMALLALHRSSSGWRLVVPASAIDRIASEIGVPKTN